MLYRTHVKFKLSEDQYQIITEENIDSLPYYMKENCLKKAIIISSEDKNGWNSTELPDLANFSFIEELLVYWTNIKNIKGIECCSLLKTLWVDNEDRTDIDFKNSLICRSLFPGIVKIFKIYGRFLH